VAGALRLLEASGTGYWVRPLFWVARFALEIVAIMNNVAKNNISLEKSFESTFLILDYLIEDV
jgi:hypothetical protein